MGKLADRIRLAKLRSDRPIGFGTRDPQAPSDRGLLIAAAGDAAHGADVLIRAADPADRAALQSAVEAAADIPLGIAATALSQTGAMTAQEAGVDFVLVGLDNVTADGLVAPELDYVVRLDDLPAEAVLKAIGTLRPVAVVVPPLPSTIPLRQILELRQIAAGTGAPLAVPVHADLSAGSIEALRDSGVVLLILDRPPAEQVQTLRDRITSLPRHSRPAPAGAATATLPQVGPPGETEDEEEEFEDRGSPAAAR